MQAGRHGKVYTIGGEEKACLHAGQSPEYMGLRLGLRYNEGGGDKLIHYSVRKMYI